MKRFLKDLSISLIISAGILLVIAHAPDIKGAGASENAFSWKDREGQQISVPYNLEGNPIVIHGESFTMINPSPQRQFLRVTGPEGQYRIRHRLAIKMPARIGFVVETVTLTDSTVTSRFEVQTTS